MMKKKKLISESKEKSLTINKLGRRNINPKHKSYILYKTQNSSKRFKNN
jgi:hypothetical protein